MDTNHLLYAALFNACACQISTFQMCGHFCSLCLIQISLEHQQEIVSYSLLPAKKQNVIVTNYNTTEAPFICRNVCAKFQQQRTCNMNDTNLPLLNGNVKSPNFVHIVHCTVATCPPNLTVLRQVLAEIQLFQVRTTAGLFLMQVQGPFFAMTYPCPKNCGFGTWIRHGRKRTLRRLTQTLI